MSYKLLIISCVSSLLLSLFQKETVAERFAVPKDFVRTISEKNSFAYYLQHLPLLPAGTEVKLYNGNTKQNKVWSAVIDMSIGNKDLQQCADAVMRLRAEYLFEQKKYSDIHFNFTNGFNAEYSKWMAGQRIAVNGNKVAWKKSTTASSTHENLMQYMEQVFNYAGTLSLSKELKSVNIIDIKIGDVFIKGGSPGHAIIVIDMCKHKTNGETLVMLAQSYMPAQNIHVLKNGNMNDLPWFKINPKHMAFETPEWGFTINDLKRFE
jgi:Domain of unknown function (4846)